MEMKTCPYCNKMYAHSGTYCSIECLEKELPFVFDEDNTDKEDEDETIQSDRE